MEGKRIIPTGIRIRRLPFYWRVNDSPLARNIVPDFLPLELVYDTTLGLFQQKRNKRVLDYLGMIYQKEPNIGHNQEASNWKHSYGNDLYDFIARVILPRLHKPKRILEIGAGGCMILEKFKNKGYDVIGIDPSPFSRIEGRKKGMRVVQDFYPSKKLSGTFDLIYHSNVLEHINDPVRFLRSQYDQLKDGGYVAIAVPDCTAPLRHGDVSILYHQHLTFFEEDSLARMVERAGFVNAKVRVAGYGGNLYCMGEKKKDKKCRRLLLGKFDTSPIAKFVRKHQRLKNDISRYIMNIVKERERSLGIYAPLRALPYLAMMNLYKGFRFFDDTSYWHRKFFDGVPILFENFNDLKQNPVTDMLVMSPTFEDIIVQKIQSQFGNTIRVKKLTDFYA